MTHQSYVIVALFFILSLVQACTVGLVADCETEGDILCDDKKAYQCNISNSDFYLSRISDYDVDYCGAEEEQQDEIAVEEITDTDEDDVVDSQDICEGYDDANDADSDTVPDGCDLCHGEDDTIDVSGESSVPDCLEEPTAPETITYEFSSLSGTATNLESDGSALVLSQNADRTYVEEGYWESDYIDAEDISERVIILDETRINLFENGDFEPQLEYSKSSKTPFIWYTLGQDVSATTEDSNHLMQLRKLSSSSYVYLEQPVPVDSDQTYIFSFDVDPSDLEDDQLMAIVMRYQGADGTTNLELTYPLTSGTATTKQTQLKQYSNILRPGRNQFLIKTPDCQTHRMDDSSYTYNQYSAGSADCDDALQYLSLTFYANPNYNGHAKIDGVILDPEYQIITELVNSAGDTVQVSTEEMFSVETIDQPVKIRVTLRSEKPTVSPEVRSIKITDAVAQTIQIGSLKERFDQERMGATMGIPPRSEWISGEYATVRSQCVDFETGDQMSCFALEVQYGVSRMRSHLTWNYLTATYNEETEDYDLSLNSNGKVIAERMQEAMDAGKELEFIIVVDGSFFTSDGSEKYPDVTGQRSDYMQEQIPYLLKKHAQYYAELFDGDPYGEITLWEIFNEPNIDKFKPSWDEDISDEELVALQNEIAAAILEVRHDVEITTASVSPADEKFFPLTYLESIIDYYDLDRFDAFNFHPYSGSTDPEEIVDYWEKLDAFIEDNDLEDKDIYFTEYGYNHPLFDPENCNYYDSTTKRYTYIEGETASWYRGWGDDAFAKRLARATVSYLSGPVKGLYLYGQFSPEQEAGGGNVNMGSTYPCWYVDAQNTFNIWESEGGILSGIDEPTVYYASPAAKAFYTLSKHLSFSSPYETVITSINEIDPTSSAFPFYRKNYAAYFETENKHVLALWGYKEYAYGLEYMNYVTGAKDEGYTETLKYDVTLTDAEAFETAVLYRLDDLSTETLDVVENNDGTYTIKGVQYGEMPVLIEFR